MTDSTATPSPQRHRPWGWIVTCSILVVIAVGLLIWGLGVQSDLDDQRDQTAQAQQQADQASDQLSAVSDQVDEISQTVSDAQQSGRDAIAELEDKLSSVRDQLAGAVEKIKSQTDGG